MKRFMKISLINHIYPAPPLGQDMTQGHFFAEFNMFEFKVFILQD